MFVATIADLSRISGQAGAGIQLPQVPSVPLPAGILKAFPELTDWQTKQNQAWADWLRTAIFNLNQP